MDSQVLDGAGAVARAARPDSSGPNLERVGVYLHAGQVFASQAPCEISTVLGSCVAVCLFDSIRKSGGANHFVLPNHAADEPPLRYGDQAILALVTRMLGLGSNKRDLVAKVFGGASLVRGEQRGSGTSLGWRNVLIARSVLQREGIPITAEDVGNSFGRRVVFYTDEGLAWVKHL